MATPQKLVLTVTEEQLEVLQGLYTSFGWDLPEPEPEHDSQDDGMPHQDQEQERESAESSDEEEVQEDHDGDRNRNECNFCFLEPCVTSFHHEWLGNGQPPHKNNPGLRKERYRKYWQIIANCGGWNHPRYIHRKATAENTDDPDGMQVWSKRDIMPECVLKHVRGLYPNPPGQPYMGHKWK